MRIGFFVNDVQKELVHYTTNGLALAALAQGHEAWMFGVDDLKYSEDDKVRAIARHVPKEKYKSTEFYLKDLKGKNARVEQITLDDLDILFLRFDPAREPERRHWARRVGIDFGRAAMRNGVLVLNDPNGLSHARNKMYFQLFPPEVRPKTIITRNREQIKEFASKRKGFIILKPLQGFGGKGIFKVRASETSNLNQIIDALSDGGYIVAQEYLEDASKGDTRLFLINGQPLKYKGKYAAFRRIISEEHGMPPTVSFERAVLTDDILEIAEVVRPKLVRDGIFFARLDIVGNKLMEINVFTAGGLDLAQKFEGPNFCTAIIGA
ncbi:MAG: hypothetical protein K8F91_27565, partial [Candidatus Obscuribacterales bacterium]|nr:hypothetical protein [Candidatus Obscuribacterales bacterium]